MPEVKDESSTMNWIVKAEFVSRDDALALIDLASELGIKCELGQSPVNGKLAPVHQTRLGKIVLKILSDAPGSLHYEDVAVKIEELDFSPLSANGTLSKLVHEGFAIRLASGVYSAKR